MNMHFTFNISIDDRIITFFKRALSRRTAVILVAISAIAASAVLFAAVTKPHTFTPGAVISSSQVNANFDAAFRELSRSAPVGAIVAWHKSMFNTPTLPDGWVECNGQVLSDGESVYNGQTIPNLNGAMGGADSPDIGRRDSLFLRGGTVSGVGQEHSFQQHNHTHNHTWTHSWGDGTRNTAYWAGASFYTYHGSATDTFSTENAPATSGNYGTETRPVNMSVVWIMRVK
jgi:hypothetical protein